MNYFLTSIPIITFSFLAIIDSKSQSFGIIRDSITNEPIPFVNIWLDKELMGTTTNEKGEFYFKSSIIGKHVVFSSIGYKTKHYLFLNTETILLKPEIIQLKEVVIRNQKEKTNTVGQKINITDVRRFFFCDGVPYMKARYFPYTEEFYKTPNLYKVEIVTNSALDQASFNLRLYTMDNEGKPGKPIYNENIVVVVKKGRNLTTIDLTDKAILFPRTGLLIAFEYLIIQANEFSLSSEQTTDSIQTPKIVYSPAIGTTPTGTGEIGWLYTNGNWIKDNENTASVTGDGRKFNQLAIRITLSN